MKSILNISFYNENGLPKLKIETIQYHSGIVIDSGVLADIQGPFFQSHPIVRRLIEKGCFKSAEEVMRCIKFSDTAQKFRFKNFIDIC